MITFTSCVFMLTKLWTYTYLFHLLNIYCSIVCFKDDGFIEEDGGFKGSDTDSL
jgi:hypothetical protein